MEEDVGMCSSPSTAETLLEGVPLLVAWNGFKHRTTPVMPNWGERLNRLLILAREG